MSREPKVRDKIKLNAVSGETGVISKVMQREFLEPLYEVKWDDKELGTGVLFEHEFDLIEEAS